MPAIKKVTLHNFKKFESLTLDFAPDVNVLIGDNETGKSSVLLALDLALSASRSRVETIGYESLLSQYAVRTFLKGQRTLDLLPESNTTLAAIARYSGGKKAGRVDGAQQPRSPS